MPQLLEIHGGSWWRFEEYCIQDGYIRPKPGARLLKYDPWETFRITSRVDKSTHAPYLSLVYLVDTLAAPDGVKLPLSPTHEKLVLDWHAQWGTLGLLLHRTLAVVLAPRWERNIALDALSADQQGPSTLESVLRPTMYRYLRTNTGWNRDRITDPIGPPSGLLPDRPEQRDTLVSDADIPETWEKPCVYAIGTDYGHEWTRQPLSQLWAEFFPDVQENLRETHLYPCPLSEEFWHSYAEPVNHFLLMAAFFRNAFRTLTDLKMDQIQPAHRKQAPVDALEAMNAFATPASVVLEYHNGFLQETWQAPSLLGVLAVMACHDLSGRRYIGRCPICGLFFTSRKRHRSIYCGDKCKKTGQKDNRLAARKLKK